jgi:hypothetical protein
MNDKLLKRINVTVAMDTVMCVNPSCAGTLVSDGKVRNKDGIHGGPAEYRHLCDTCSAGYWLSEKFPKLVYTPIPEPPVKESKNG